MISFSIEGDIPTSNQNIKKEAKSLIPEILVLNEDTVIFLQSSNIFKIEYSSYSPDINERMERGLNVTFVRNNEMYIRGDNLCRQFFAQFPREIFVGAKNLRTFYDSVVIAF